MFACVSEGASQFGFLELSESQGLQSEVNRQEDEEDIVSLPDSKQQTTMGIQTFICIVFVIKFLCYSSSLLWYDTKNSTNTFTNFLTN